jgi:erythromycin esterase-like protein
MCEEARAVIWAHNSHLGDARATYMGDSGQLNLGQLVRETYGQQSRLIGVTTHTGTVTAATNWDEPAQRRRVRPSLPDTIPKEMRTTSGQPADAPKPTGTSSQPAEPTPPKRPGC